MINIVEILKDCPKGTKLYSPICGECRLIKIYNSLGFDVINDTDDVFNFSYDGRYNLNGECCIFPSKEQRDWSKFKKPFNDGDIVFYNNTIAIFKEWGDETLFRTYCIFYTSVNKSIFSFELDRPLFGKSVRKEIRFASEIEKQELFDAIKSNGYKWNAKTKILEKLIEPKFKAGDKIKEKNERFPSTRTIHSYVAGIGYSTTIHDWVRIEDQDNYELVPTHNFKVGDRIRQKGETSTYTITDVNDAHYFCGKYVICDTCDNDWELVSDKFDISTLKPFESKVLVRDADHNVWEAAIFGRYDGEKVFVIGGIDWNQCIPFEGNEHLYGTTNNCDEFYKTW